MRIIRFLLLAIMIGVAAPALAPKSAKAAPVAASSLASQTAAPDLTEKTRLYCYNRYSGRFLHWGPCYRRHYYYYRPHYYWHPPLLPALLLPPALLPQALLASLFLVSDGPHARERRRRSFPAAAPSAVDVIEIAFLPGAQRQRLRRPHADQPSQQQRARAL